MARDYDRPEENFNPYGQAGSYRGAADFFDGYGFGTVAERKAAERGGIGGGLLTPNRAGAGLLENTVAGMIAALREEADGIPLGLGELPGLILPPSAIEPVFFDDLFIADKNSNLIRLTPNGVQVDYLAALGVLWETGEYEIHDKREIILKARQFGFTTIILALLFINTITIPNTKTVVLADDKDKAVGIFEKVKLFYEHLPPHKRPVARYATKYEYYWPGINSRFYVGTARAKQFGRSATINNVLASEAAFYKDAEEILTGLGNAVPKKSATTRGGNLFIESTANGVGGHYHDEYQAAKRPGGSIYTPRFYAWFDHKEYTLSPEDTPEDMEAGVDEPTREKEKRIQDVYGLTDGQIAWYREAKTANRAKTVQEFPSNDTEAFISSGNPYFDAEELVLLAEEVAKAEYDPIPVTVPAMYQNLRAIASTSVIPGKRDDSAAFRALEVWKTPEKGHWYVLSADTALGLDPKSKRHDFGSGDVFDGRTWEQVAHLHCKVNTREFAFILSQLAYWYNRALLVVERNNTGRAVLATLKDEIKYPRQDTGQRYGLFYPIVYAKDRTAKEAEEPGWDTTPKSKFVALDGLADSLTDKPRSLIIRSRLTVSELRTFVKKPGGGVGGESGAHDDAVISCSVGDAVLKIARSSSSGVLRTDGFTASGGQRAVPPPGTDPKARPGGLSLMRRNT